ncbi:hypothetical protein CRE_31334 [Caenorhabditis remanei]|uniref:DUF7637 domain-containing protein n=1 Tax=Caenorhabditis remanei TaxID=31234 RepID=E3MY88_CAERE|nr:hypothetical protein CRE_31334 [Caenorhabditis remanei]
MREHSTEMKRTETHSKALIKAVNNHQNDPKMEEKGYRGWMKLKIPCSTFERQMNSIIRCHTTKLEHALNSSNMRILTRGQVHAVEEQDCDIYFESDYEVLCEMKLFWNKMFIQVSSDKFSHRLIIATQNFLKDLKQERLMPFQLGNLVLHSSDFWSSELTCHLVDIPLNAFFFGSKKLEADWSGAEECEFFGGISAGFPIVKTFQSAIDLKQLSEDERRQRLAARKPKVKITKTKVIDATFDESEYMRFWSAPGRQKTSKT